MNTLTIDNLMQIQSEADILYDEEEVLCILDTLAQKISKTLQDSNPLVLSVMTGGMIPTGLLLPKLQFPLQIDYIHATRYRGETHGKELVWLKRPEFEVKDRTVLIIDDILDKGQTLHAIVEEIKGMQAKKIYTAVLVEKQTKREAHFHSADFTGFTVPDRYVFGCGMDYKTYYRNSLAIYAVKQ